MLKRLTSALTPMWPAAPLPLLMLLLFPSFAHSTSFSAAYSVNIEIRETIDGVYYIALDHPVNLKGIKFAIFKKLGKEKISFFEVQKGFINIYYPKAKGIYNYYLKPCKKRKMHEHG
jgi:hypothetical protein